MIVLMQIGFGLYTRHPPPKVAQCTRCFFSLRTYLFVTVVYKLCQCRKNLARTSERIGCEVHVGHRNNIRKYLHIRIMSK